jgi:lipopolysaccharide/colanic/teichoic acid biosynthesis glycosyltransferase
MTAPARARTPSSRALGATRLFDLALTLLALPFALVVGLAVAVAIFIDSPGPIFYRARRIGRGGRPFEMLKFRKMRRDAAGPALTRHQDERLTPLGHFLVASKLDELPQLWNVLRGEMSLVGPRPEVEEFVELFPEQYALILTVTPGITGPAQIEYVEEGRLLADADAHDSSELYAREILPRKIEVDLDYIRYRTFRGDVALIAHTAVLPARRLGARVLVRARRTRLRTAVAYGVATIATLALVVSFAVQSGPLP